MFLLIALMVVAVFSALASIPFWVPAVWKRIPSRPTALTAALDVIVASLESEPETWSWSHYEAKKNGVLIWIANKDYGLHIDIDHSRIELTNKQKWRVWQAVRTAQKLGGHGSMAHEIVKRIGSDNVVAIKRKVTNDGYNSY